MSDHAESLPRLFNSVFETGVRAVFVLVAAYPESLDLEDLIALDHLVVHSEDGVGRTVSIPQRARTRRRCWSAANWSMMGFS